MTPSVESMKKGTCGCGRSPTGDCIGWHGLTEEQYKVKLVEPTEAKQKEVLRILVPGGKIADAPAARSSSKS